MGRRFILEDWHELVVQLKERLQGKYEVTLNELYEMMDREIGEETIRVWIRRGYIDAGKQYHGGYIRKDSYSKRPFVIKVESVLKFLERFEKK